MKHLKRLFIGIAVLITAIAMLFIGSVVCQIVLSAHGNIVQMVAIYLIALVIIGYTLGWAWMVDPQEEVITSYNPVVNDDNQDIEEWEKEEQRKLGYEASVFYN